MIFNPLKQQKKIKKNSFEANETNMLKENLLWYRDQKGWSQEEMAAFFNLTRGMIASYERGTIPNLDMVSKICKELNVYLHQFIEEDMKSFEQQEHNSHLKEEPGSYNSNKDELILSLKEQLAAKDKIIALLEKK